MSSTVRARIAVIVAVSSLVVACSSGDDVATPSTPPDVPPTTSDGTAASTSSAPSTTSPPTSIALPSTTIESPTTTTVATTLPPTTTTEPVAVQELILDGEGIGSARFGAAADGVIDYVTSILGGNTGDTGWVDPLTFAVCDGTVARRVDWGVLSLLFSDLSEFADGRRHFMGYEYGRVDQVGEEPIGLRTAGGTTLGGRIVDLLAEFPDAAVNPGETDIDIPPNFYVSDNFRGLITGVDSEDVVTVILGGYGCGA